MSQLLAQNSSKRVGVSAGYASMFGLAIGGISSINSDLVNDLGNYEFSIKSENSKRWSKQFSFNIETIEVRKNNDYDKSNSSTEVISIINLMIGFSANYYNSETLRYYSGLHGGIMTTNNETFPSLNLTVLGFEHKKTRLFVEFNAGMKAIGLIGITF